MNYTVILLFIILSFPFVSLPAKSEKESYIKSAFQFQRWCKILSYRHFRRKNQQAYNWSSSTIRKLNDYQTTGSWKVNNVERDVFCQIRIGKKAKNIKLEIR